MAEWSKAPDLGSGLCWRWFKCCRCHNVGRRYGFRWPVVVLNSSTLCFSFCSFCKTSCQRVLRQSQTAADTAPLAPVQGDWMLYGFLYAVLAIRVVNVFLRQSPTAADTFFLLCTSNPHAGWLGGNFMRPILLNNQSLLSLRNIFQLTQCWSVKSHEFLITTYKNIELHNSLRCRSV